MEATAEVATLERHENVEILERKLGTVMLYACAVVRWLELGGPWLEFECTSWLKPQPLARGTRQVPGRKVDVTHLVPRDASDLPPKSGL